MHKCYSRGMTLPFPKWLAASLALVVLAPSCSSTSTEEEPSFGEEGCDNLDESACLFPFPSDFFRKPGGPYGQKYHLDFGDKLPVSSRTGERVSSDAFKVHDGYPVVPAITFVLPKASTTGTAPLEDIAASQRPDSKTLIIDTQTGERVAHWVELDYHAEDLGERIFQIRVADALQHDRRYVVAIRGLVDDAGQPVPATRGFEALRDNKPTRGYGLEERRAHFEADVFPVLERAGVARSELQLAWDFTTTTFEGSTSRLLTMRDRLYDAIGDQGPEYTVTNVVTDPDGPDGPIAKIIEAVAKVPSFVLPPPGDAQPRRLRLDANGLPTIEGFEDVKFRVQVPRIALTAPNKMAVMQYGHGFLGRDGEANNGWIRDWSNRHGFLILSANMQGMDQVAGVVWFLRLPEDATNASHIAEEPLQGLINHLALQRLMKGRFLTDPNIQGTSGPIYDPERLYYHGNSQGGTMGNLVVLPSRDVKRALLGVPGVAIGFLLARASQWEEQSSLLSGSYSDVFGFTTVMCLVQLGWDKTDAINFAPRWADLPNTPPKQVLLQAALEDSQVNIDVSRLLARLYKAKLVQPATREVFGLEPGVPPITGANAYTEVDYGVPPRPKSNRPANAETDTHGYPRKQKTMQDQAWHFFETGEVIHTCDGPCDPE